MQLSRRNFLLAGACAAPFAGAPMAPASAEAMLEAAQGTPAPDFHPVYTHDGLALGGYDPVAYFRQGGPAPGRPEHRLKYHGAVWLFTSEENLIAFEMNPLAYKPRFGGYCAYTVANGMPMKSDPDAWTIHDGRLYLNYNLTLRILWRRDIPGQIARAERQWARIMAG